MKTPDAVAIKNPYNSDDGCLITLRCFINTFWSSILNLVLYWVGNNIMDVVDSIQSEINLHWIPTYSTKTYPRPMIIS